MLEKKLTGFEMMQMIALEQNLNSNNKRIIYCNKPQFGYNFSLFKQDTKSRKN